MITIIKINKKILKNGYKHVKKGHIKKIVIEEEKQIPNINKIMKHKINLNFFATGLVFLFFNFLLK